MKTLPTTIEANLRRLWLRRNEAAFADRGAPRRPRLLVDVSVILRSDARTGIQRVVRSIWAHLNSLDCEKFDVVPVYAARRRGYCYAPLDFLSKSHPLGARPVGMRKGDCFLGLDLAAQYLPKWTEQIDAWRANGATVHVVLYDLLPSTRPDWFAPATGERFASWLDTIIARADQLLCISDVVAGELRTLLRQLPVGRRPQIGRLHLSGDVSASIPSSGLSPAEATTLELAGKTPTFLMVGTVEPRKAYDQAISAFEKLWSASATAPSLLIIGKPGWKTAAVQDRIRRHPEFGRRLHWLEHASDEALDQAYAVGRALLVASHAEGFGLPLAEAALHGRWALVRDLPVFREQQLPNTRYFTKDSPTALAQSIEAIADVAEQRDPPRAQIQSWSWCVERLLQEIGLIEEPRQAHQLRLAAAS